jgi:hypothetical protein
VISRLRETSQDSDIDNSFDTEEDSGEESVLTERESLVDDHDQEELSESISSTTAKTMKRIQEEVSQAQKIRRAAIQTKAEEKKALVSFN